MAKNDQQTVSIRPSDFVAGGGLPNDIDVEIRKARVEMFTYPGGDTEALTVKLDFVNIETGDEYSQNLSAGTGFVPNNDGTGFTPTGTKTSLTDGTNFFIFLASACNEGFPEEKIANDVSIFEGLQCHIERKEQKKVQADKKREVMVVTSIIALPWETKKKKKVAATSGGDKKAGATASKSGVAASGKTTTKPAASASKASSNGDDHSERAAEVLAEIVANADGTIERSKLRGAAFKLLMKEAPVRNGVIALFDDDEKLAEIVNAAGLEYDGETVSAGG